MVEIDTSRTDLVEEFRRTPVGRHSADLRYLLNRMRTAPELPNYVLVCTKPQREWLLATKETGRGTPAEIDQGHVFTDPNEAEWEVFKLRWQALTGEAID